MLESQNIGQVDRWVAIDMPLTPWTPQADLRTRNLHQDSYSKSCLFFKLMAVPELTNWAA